MSTHPMTIVVHAHDAVVQWRKYRRVALRCQLFLVLISGIFLFKFMAMQQAIRFREHPGNRHTLCQAGKSALESNVQVPSEITDARHGDGTCGETYWQFSQITEKP